MGTWKAWAPPRGAQGGGRRGVCARARRSRACRRLGVDSDSEPTLPCDSSPATAGRARAALGSRTPWPLP